MEFSLSSQIRQHTEPHHSILGLHNTLDIRVPNEAPWVLKMCAIRVQYLPRGDVPNTKSSSGARGDGAKKLKMAASVRTERFIVSAVLSD